MIRPCALICFVVIVLLGCGDFVQEGQEQRPHPRMSGAIAQDKDDWSPLHLAVLEGDLSKVKELISDGADFRAANPVTMWTPLDIAALYDKERILEYLVERWREDGGAPPDIDELLLTAVLHGNHHSAGYLLDEGGDANYRSHEFEPLLRVAAIHDHQETMELLVANGAVLNAATSEGLTALHGAAEKSVRGVAYLIESGAAVDARTIYGYTPLHIAAEHGRADVVACLLEAGADPGAQTKAGRTPLDLARRKGQIEAARALESGIPK